MGIFKHPPRIAGHGERPTVPPPESWVRQSTPRRDGPTVADFAVFDAAIEDLANQLEDAIAGGDDRQVMARVSNIILKLRQKRGWPLNHTVSKSLPEG